MSTRRAFFAHALAAVPFTTQLTINGREATAAAKLHPGAHYLLFVDVQVADCNLLMEQQAANLPEDCVVEIIPLKLKHGQTMDEAVRLYRVEKDL
jgi:hypothetical protein